MTSADTIDETSKESTDQLGALALIRRGIAASPELRVGLGATVAMGFAVAIGKLVIPVLIERTIDNGIVGEGEVDIGYVVGASVLATIVIILSAFLSWAAQRRLVRQAELAIANLRVNTFDRIHRFSIADHNETQKGALVSRVTSDMETLGRFAQWGLYIWSIQPVVVVGVIVLLFFYSWQLALVVLAVHLPVVPTLLWLQRQQLVIYDDFRTRVAEMLSTFSEVVTGSTVIRAYGAKERFAGELDGTIRRRYKTRMRANRYMAGLFVIGDLYGAVALAAVLVLGLSQRGAWGIGAGDLIGVVFLVSLLREPIAELAEVIDQTQVAAASWRKILAIHDHPIDVPEPDDGLVIDGGAIAIDVENVDFAYSDGDLVLRDVTVSIPAGLNVAVVGETGSGKTTFAKLLCRLADPLSGSIKLNGSELRDVEPESRIASVRLVPQDGFLFDASIFDNVSFGLEDCTEQQARHAFDALGLGWWLDRAGLHTPVGERGESLSVGERQLVALARAQLADPGLLILDEATSAVDPEIDQALTEALQRLAEGRTMISVAHRLSTAEVADLVLVFDQSRLVEIGSHEELVVAGGVYASLHEAWIGNTRSQTSLS